MKGLLGRAKRLAAWVGDTVPGKVVRKFGEDNGQTQAIVIAWNMLTSFFPIVLALAAIAGLVLSHMGISAQTQIETAALSRLPQSAGDTAAALATIKQRTGIFFLIGLAGLVWSGSSLFGAMEQSFDLIFHVRTRDFVHQKVMAVLMMLLFAGLSALVLLSTSALALLKALPLVPAAVTNSVGVYVLQPVFGIVAGVVLFGAMYYVVPNRKQTLRETWPGALFAGVAFYVMTLAFPLYLSIAGRGMNQYGKSFAFLFIVMTFFYFIGLITMLGVELNAVLHPVPIEQPGNAARLAPPNRVVATEPSAGGARRAPAAPARESEASGAARQQSQPLRPLPQRLAYGFVGAAIGVFAFARHGRRRVA